MWGRLSTCGRLSAGLLLFAATCPAAAPDLRKIERRVFDLVNQERRRAGVPPLQWDDALAAEARRHSYNMMARWFFSHEDPIRGALNKRLKSANLPWGRCAENIFSEQGYADPAEMAVQGWLKSPGHRANMLDPRLTHTGIGAAQRSDATIYITQDFISPKPAAANSPR